jgi:hypothetical protein
MTWPTSSDWTSGQPLSAWFQETGATSSSAVKVCATQGRSFIRRLQRKLNELGVPARNLAIDGNWGNDTTSALIILAGRFAAQARTGMSGSAGDNPWPVYSDALVNGRNGRNISRQMLQFAVWVTYYVTNADDWRRATVPIERVAIPLGGGSTQLVLPRYGSAPDDDRGAGDGALTCWDRDRDTPPVPATREQVDQGRSTGSTGVTTPPVTGGATGGAAGGSSGSSNSNSGGGGGGGGGGGLLLLGLGALALMSMGGGKSRGGRRRRR